MNNLSFDDISSGSFTGEFPIWTPAPPEAFAPIRFSWTDDSITPRQLTLQPDPIREPIWISSEGRCFYDPSEFTNGHLINIFHWLIDNGRHIRHWVIPELRRRKISLDTPRQPNPDQLREEV